MRRFGALLAAVALAGCGSTPPADVAQPAPQPAAAVSAAPSPVGAEPDQCGAVALQGLVGRPRSEIPVPVDPARQRVACSACAVTQDYSPARLNFFFDADTGLIQSVRCG